MEAAVKGLKIGKSAGIDNIPEELVQTGEVMIEESWPQSATTFGRPGNGRSHELRQLEAVPELQKHQPS